MISLRSSKKRTLIGYHDKNENRYGIIEQDFPILTEERYSPFLLTPRYNFQVSTKELLSLLKNYYKIRRFHKLKLNIANLLILPGLIVAMLYIVRSFGLFDSIPTLLGVTSNTILNFTFWVSVLGGIILWHDYFRTRSHPITLPAFKPFDESELENIKLNGVRFGKYEPLKAVNYLEDHSQALLTEFYTPQGLDCYNLLRFLLEMPEIEEVVKRAGMDLNPDKFAENGITPESMPKYPVPAMRSLIIYALEEAILSKSINVTPIHFMLAMIKVFPILQQYINKTLINSEVLREVESYYNEIELRKERVNILNPKHQYYRTGGILRDVLFGYTFILDKFSKDITQEIINVKDLYGIGHEKEVDALISVLGKNSRKNALLIGQPGTGKSSIIKGLAQRINWGDIPAHLSRMRIIQLDLNGLIAYDAAHPENLESLIQKAFSELEKAGNVILFIDEIQETIPAKAAESGQAVSSILLPYLIDNKFPIIGTINYADYKKYFYNNDSIRNSFENIEVKELSTRDTFYILKTKIRQLEESYGIYITFPALYAAIELSQRYVTDRRLPDSAVATFESACSWAQSHNEKVVNNSTVSQFLSTKIDAPIETVTAQEATKLLQLEERIKQKVVGQDEAVHSVVEAIKRARTDIRDQEKPIGVYLFMGPTGTGKTYLAQILSQEYFGHKSDIIRLDMSEYQTTDSISRLIGSDKATADQDSATTTLVDRVKANPFSVVLFDEIEKAHPQILDLFLQIFDEGRLTSKSGETISFNNTIIICTSNIGSQMLLESLEKDETMWEEAKNRALLELRQSFKPELINRFDKTIIFAPHDIEELKQITELMLEELATRLSDKNIELKWGQSIPMLITNRSKEPGMGARPIRRFIQEKIEGVLADEILKLGENINGKTIEIRESWLN